MSSKFLNGSTVDKKEIQKFSKLSEDWWNEKGKFLPLHKLSKFLNLEEIHIFLINLYETAEIEYINNIENFLNSSDFCIFTNEHYKQTLLRTSYTI